jgi:hypothetical protein
MGRTKHPASYRLSPECLALIERLSAVLGISQTGVVEQAVRKLAREELPAGEATAEKPQAAEPKKPARRKRK